MRRTVKTLKIMAAAWLFTGGALMLTEANEPKKSDGANDVALKPQWATPAMIEEAAHLHPFDLQGRMKLAVNAMTSTVMGSSEAGYSPYGACGFTYVSTGGLPDCVGRYSDALWMIRSATNNHYNDAVVQRYIADMKKMDGEDLCGSQSPDPDRPRDKFTHLPQVTRIALGLVSYYRATGDRTALEPVKLMIHRFYAIAEKNERYLWYPDYDYEQVTEPELIAKQHGRNMLPKNLVLNLTHKTTATVDTSNPHSGFFNANRNQPSAMMGLILMPAVRYYNETRDPVAAELVTKFSQYVVDFGPDFGKTVDQTHSNLATISGILITGRCLGIPEFSAWAEKAYRDFRSLDYLPDFGWLPETTDRPRKEGLLWDETCGTADYLEVALQLAKYRDEVFWDVAERIAMNQLMESQMLRIDFMDRIPASAKVPAPSWGVADHVLERSLGNFGVYVTPNDLVHVVPPESPMVFGGYTISPLGGCCLGSGARALYETWYYAAQEDDETVWVNMQFSKRLPSAEIISYMPGRAALEIKMTAGKRLLVRKPDWADAKKVNVSVDAKEKRARMAGAYFDVGRLKRGSLVKIEFPNELKAKKQIIGEVAFDTMWRGNALVKIEPSGKIYPLYQGRERADGVRPEAYLNARPVNPL